MRCLVCHNEIDELRSFATVVDASGKVLEDVVGRFRHQQDLSAWTHVVLTAQKGGGSLTVLSGHVCPDHAIEAGSLAICAPATDLPGDKT